MAKKKLLLWGCLGCGGFILLLVIFMAAGIGWVVYTGMEYGKEMQSMYTNLKTQYNALDANFTYTPPEGGVLVEGRYKEFLQIRKDITGFSEEYIKQFEEIGGRIGEQFDSGFWGMFSGIGSIKEIIETAVKMMPEIGSEHVKLLTQHEMSMREYIWLCKHSIGALAKSQDHNNEPGTELWLQYSELFQEVAVIIQDVNVNNQQWNSRDFNLSNFQAKMLDVEFIEENATIVVNNKDLLLEPKYAPALDYFAVHFDEMIKQHQQGKNN